MPVASVNGLETPFSSASTQTPPQARTISSAGLSWAMRGAPPAERRGDEAGASGGGRQEQAAGELRLVWRSLVFSVPSFTRRRRTGRAPTSRWSTASPARWRGMRPRVVVEQAQDARRRAPARGPRRRGGRPRTPRPAISGREPAVVAAADGDRARRGCATSTAAPGRQRRTVRTSSSSVSPTRTARRRRRDLAAQEIGEAEEARDEAVGGLARRSPRRVASAACGRWSMTMTRSDMTSASRWSWVTLIVVTPSSRWMRRNSSCISSRSLRSRAASGSSSSSRSGSNTSARAIATRCCWPPDSSCGRRCAEAVEPDERRGSARPAARISARGEAAHPQRDRRRSRTRSGAGTAPASGTPCRSSGARAAAAATGWPWITISPAVGAMKPAIMRSSVVLPQPDGPRMVRKAPASSARETSSTARLSPIAPADAGRAAPSAARSLPSALPLFLPRSLGRDVPEPAGQRGKLTAGE